MGSCTHRCFPDAFCPLTRSSYHVSPTSDHDHLHPPSVPPCSPTYLHLLKPQAAPPLPQVGSVESFQGQERKAIIISTVRSSHDQIHFDRLHDMGFLNQPKRFNVALTRAMSMLIVVGNPAVLAVDLHWRALLRHALAVGAYVGVPPPALPDEATEPAELEPALMVSSTQHSLPPPQLPKLTQVEDIDDRLDDEAVGGTPMASARLQQEGMEMPTFD